MKIRNLINSLGPGLLWAGAAIGVSHLVQSTRAGAIYGFQLVAIILFINLIKYQGQPWLFVGLQNLPRLTVNVGSQLLGSENLGAASPGHDPAFYFKKVVGGE